MSVDTVFVPGVRVNPDRALRPGHPGAVIGADGQDAVADVHQLMLFVLVSRGVLAGQGPCRIYDVTRQNIGSRRQGGRPVVVL